jgi:hypothetical protein
MAMEEEGEKGRRGEEVRTYFTLAQGLAASI